VQAGRPRVTLPKGEHERLLQRFQMALAADDAPALIALLSPNVTLASDGGGRARAARRRLVGPDRVSKFLLGITRKFGQSYQLTRLNGEPGLLVIHEDVVTSAYSFEIDDTGIRAVHIVRNPDKLGHILQPTEPLL
jgi:RNA polymerase sigma-70 factor (ECF subfamily)